MVLWRFVGASTDPLVLYWKCCRYSCVYPGEGASVSGSPWKSQKYSIPLQCWSSEESQSCQLSIQCWAIIGLPANSMAFRWWPHVVTLTVSPSWTPCPPQVLRLNTLSPPPPQSFLATPMWFSSWCNQSCLNSIKVWVVVGFGSYYNLIISLTTNTSLNFYKKLGLRWTIHISDPDWVSNIDTLTIQFKSKSRVQDNFTICNKRSGN